MGRFFSFQMLIASDFIRALYFIGMAVITVGGALLILGISKGVNIGIPLDMRVQGVFLLIFGNLFWRLLCEAWILLFRVYETLVEIQNNTEILKQLRKKKSKRQP